MKLKLLVTYDADDNYSISYAPEGQDWEELLDGYTSGATRTVELSIELPDVRVDQIAVTVPDASNTDLTASVAIV